MLVRKLIFSTQIILFFEKEFKKFIINPYFYQHLYLSLVITIFRNSCYAEPPISSLFLVRCCHPHSSDSLLFTVNFVAKGPKVCSLSQTVLPNDFSVQRSLWLSTRCSYTTDRATWYPVSRKHILS